MTTRRKTAKLLGFAFAVGFALGTPSPIWANVIPAPRFVVRSGGEQIYEGTAVLTQSERGTLVQAHPGPIATVRFSEGLPLLQARAVIPSSLELKDETLPGCAIVRAQLVGTTLNGWLIIRYDIRGSYGENVCRASAEVSLVRIFYSIP